MSENPQINLNKESCRSVKPHFFGNTLLYWFTNKRTVHYIDFTYFNIFTAGVNNT